MVNIYLLDNNLFKDIIFYDSQSPPMKQQYYILSMFQTIHIYI